jgi:hypothetical protein
MSTTKAALSGHIAMIMPGCTLPRGLAWGHTLAYVK